MKTITTMLIVAALLLAASLANKKVMPVQESYHSVGCVEDGEIQEYIIVVLDGTDMEAYGQQFCNSIEDL